MERTSSPERVATARSDDDRESVRDDIGVDGEWEYQRIPEGPRRRRSVEACMRSFQDSFPHSSLTFA